MVKKLLSRGVILKALAAFGIMTTTWNVAIAQDDSTTTVQTIESMTMGQDLVLDANDFPVLAYQHVSTRGLRSLKVARCTDVNCDGVLVARVAQLGSGLPVDTDTTGPITVMLDSNDHPVVGYTQDNQLSVARCLDRLCKRTSQQTLGSGHLAAFALDKNDVIVAAYATQIGGADSTSWAIDLARCSDKRCSAVTNSRIETAERKTPQRVALAIDSNDMPVLSFRRGDRFESANSTIIARCVDSACNVINKTTIIEDGFLNAPVMVLDSSDNPIVTVVSNKGDRDDLNHYIACLDVDCNNRQERILRTNWERNLSVHPRSLAIADDGSVTFVIIGESDGDMWPELFRCATTSCDTVEYRGLISGTPVWGERPALAVDQAGESVVAFGVWQYYTTFSNDLRGLRVARCGSEPCVNIQDVQSGTYYLQSVLNNQYLGVNADTMVGTSSEPGPSETWFIDVDQRGNASIRNIESDTYLDLFLPFPRRVGALAQLTTNSSKRWSQILLDGRGFGALRDSTLKGPHVLEINEAGSGVVGEPFSFENRLESRRLWRIVPTPVAPNELVGTRIALQNTITGRWLDNDLNGEVDQSVNQSADDVWLVQDAGEGYVYLMNDFTGLYLNAEQNKLNLDSSSTRTLDNRWELRSAGDKLTVRSIDYDGYVSAQSFRNGFNSIRQSGVSASSYWTPRIIQ